MTLVQHKVTAVKTRLAKQQ